MNPLRLAVIGVGHLGKEHARILASLEGVELVGVADASLEQARTIARKHDTQAFADFWPLLNLVDAACVVVPTVFHAQVAREFLRRGISLLIEKPLAPSAAEASEIVDLAQQHKCVLQVGHIERFNPAFEVLKARPLRPSMIKAQRLGPFTGRSTDIGVVLDLMIHDLDLILDLVQSPVRQVHATGLSVFGAHEDYASARIEFTSGTIAEVTASRASPTAQRTMQIWGPEGFADVDFGARKVTLMQPSPSVRAHGLDPAKLDPASRSRIRDELFTRHLELTTIEGQAQDQLTAELRHFTECVRTGREPRVTGAQARDTVILAEQILASLRSHRWESGGQGPMQLPAAQGSLFPQRGEQEAAA